MQSWICTQCHTTCGPEDVWFMCLRAQRPSLCAMSIFACEKHPFALASAVLRCTPLHVPLRASAKPRSAEDLVLWRPFVTALACISSSDLFRFQASHHQISFVFMHEHSTCAGGAGPTGPAGDTALLPCRGGGRVPLARPAPRAAQRLRAPRPHLPAGASARARARHCIRHHASGTQCPGCGFDSDLAGGLRRLGHGGAGCRPARQPCSCRTTRSAAPATRPGAHYSAPDCARAHSSVILRVMMRCQCCGLDLRELRVKMRCCALRAGGYAAAQLI